MAQERPRGLVPILPRGFALPAAPPTLPAAWNPPALPALRQPAQRAVAIAADRPPPVVFAPARQRAVARPSGAPRPLPGAVRDDRAAASMVPVSEQGPQRRPAARRGAPVRPRPEPPRLPVRSTGPGFPDLPCPPVPSGAYRRQACTCPMCGHFVSVSDIESGPYTVDLYCQDIGGPVRPGRVRTDYRGRVIDHSHNRRGSIDSHPYWDQGVADVLAEEIADQAARITAAARAGELLRPGESRT
jgi:hypothetical protein